jgi:hypothetical protein
VNVPIALASPPRPNPCRGLGVGLEQFGISREILKRFTHRVLFDESLHLAARDDFVLRLEVEPLADRFTLDVDREARKPSRRAVAVLEDSFTRSGHVYFLPRTVPLHPLLGVIQRLPHSLPASHCTDEFFSGLCAGLVRLRARFERAHHALDQRPIERGLLLRARAFGQKIARERAEQKCDHEGKQSRA